jgi:hypothetical protein
MRLTFVKQNVVTDACLVIMAGLVSGVKNLIFLLKLMIIANVTRSDE